MESFIETDNTLVVGNIGKMREILNEFKDDEVICKEGLEALSNMVLNNSKYNIFPNKITIIL